MIIEDNYNKHPNSNENMESININDIIIEEKERTRFFTGKDVSKLKKSIKEIGLLHPITVNEELKLIAGYRRLKACKELGWSKIPVIVKRKYNELEELSIELQENLRRKSLSPYEIDVALAKWKRIYEEFHPETKRGAVLKKSKKKKKKEYSNNHSVAKSATLHINERSPDDSEYKAVRFTRIASDYTNKSERSIRDRIQIGEAILDKNFDEDSIKKYKKNLIPRSKMIQIDRERRKQESDTTNVDFDNENRSTFHLNSSFKKDESSLKNSEILTYLQNKYCKTCVKAKISLCPECGKQIIICDKGYILLKKMNSLSCTGYLEQPKE